jgi:hypothetical protein
MARAFYTATTTDGHATGISTAKTQLRITAPPAAPMCITKNPTISADGTSATDGPIKIAVYRGRSDGTGTNITVRDRDEHNPASTTAPSGKENFSANSSGGTLVFSDFVEPYRKGFPIPLAGLVLEPGESLDFETNSPTAKNVRLNCPELEV